MVDYPVVIELSRNVVDDERHNELKQCIRQIDISESAPT